MRVIVAGRLSRKVEERDQTGFDSQERESVRWAQDHGHQVVTVVADYKSGRAGLENRPKLKPWVTDPAKLAQYDAIVALKVDRLTRGNREETAELEQWARDHGKQLHIVGLDAHFPSEGNEGMVWDLMLRQAHQEWINTSERYSRMQRTLKEDGSLVGRNPYGYDIAKVDGKKTLVPNPVEAALIIEAADFYLAGETLQVICDRFNEAGRLTRTGAKWSPKTLSQVLRNETIAGRRLDGNGQAVLKVTPILPRDKWLKVIARMDKRSTRKGISQTDTPALLTSIIKCSNGHNMYAITSGYYYCRKCPKGERATVRIDHADTKMLDWIWQYQGEQPDTQVKVIPATGHQDDIDECKRDMQEAVQAEDFAKLAELQKRLEALRSLPAEPAQVVEVETGLTVRQAFEALDTAGQRAYLMEHRYTCIATDSDIVVMGIDKN